MIRTSGQHGRRAESGFSLVEILVTVLIISLVLGVVAYFQRNTWSTTRKNNNTLVAGQLIEQQLEKIRMNIARDTNTYWPPAGDNYTDPASSILVAWQYSDVVDPGGTVLTRVRNVRFVAYYPSSRPESLVVNAYVAHDF
jgi:prepilin-type N-terminal cleavage/methylation domain-containing protein